jgi:Rrf2 family protein
MRIMLDLAEKDSNMFIPLKEMAEKEEISVKYLESIITALSKKGLVEGIRGKKGGYRLTKRPEEYTAEEIIIVADGSIAPVACLRDPDYECEREEQCRMKPVYGNLYSVIVDYLGSLTLKDILDGNVERDILDS